MTRIQQVVDTLFEMFPSQDLGGGSERYQFDRLREILSSSTDWPSTLRRLYQAERCDDLALGLMWITQRLEADAARSIATPDEAEVIHRTLRRSLGLPEMAFSGFGSGDDAATPSTDSPPETTVEPFAGFGGTAGSGSQDGFGEGPTGSDVASAATSDAGSSEGPVMPQGDDDGGTSDPEIYGRLLERFLESVQSGADDRAELLTRLRANNRAVQADASMPEEFHRYSALVDDFLGYIEEHQLLDDVRVMNLVTNLQEPFAQWISTDESERSGILDQCVEMQRDFRTMFE